MSGLIFGLLSGAILLCYGSYHTIKTSRMTTNRDEQKKWKQYAMKLALLCILFLLLAIGLIYL
ncbi:hypothetical protein [Alkalihalobacterium bogoriense]|uniref:hypothetical protein n=1 Tax=Alkalihalobacterium bogoriense TaxID=246272 RepID=UPI00047A5E36|nr:hypothetical protein [Alkalihalobacterium bogoriense]